MNRERDNIIALLRQTFEGGAWHGPSVIEAIENISPEQATLRLPSPVGNRTHSIIELVSHMTSWRLYVVHKLLGDATYEVTPEMNFPSATDWPEAAHNLRTSQERLLEALSSMPASRLEEQVPGREPPLTFYTLVHGIIHHDLYHAGQIMIIRRTLLPQSI